MKLAIRIACTLTALAPLAPAQSQTLLFTGRFPFVSLDAVNERVDGTISQLSEFDFSYVTPGAGAVAGSRSTRETVPQPRVRVSSRPSVPGT